MIKISNMLIASALLSVSIVGAQGGQTRPNDPAGQPPVQEIIRRFTTAESENKIARNNYSFRQDFDIRTIGFNGSITGELHKVSNMLFDDSGKRIEKVVLFPAPTLREINVTAEDMKDLAGVQPFALSAEDLPKYQVDYKGKEKIDELNTYIFEVTPRNFVKGERYFKGRLWVDERDLQVVKAMGQAVPEVGDQKFPHFESYRENIDGKHWFPTYVYADDTLNFSNASVHIRMVVKYTDYKKAKA